MRKSHSRGGASVRASIDKLENRLLFSISDFVVQETVIIGSGGSNGVTFTASNGRYTGISVGAATATIVLTGRGIPGTVKGHTYFPKGIVETVDSITLTNAVPNRALIGIRGSFGVGSFDIPTITGGNLRSIVAPDVNLTGNLNVGSIGQLILSSVSGAMDLGSSAGNVKINGVMSGSLTVGKLRSLSATELLHEHITTTGAFSRSQLSIGTINGGNGIEDSEIISSGNIGTVRAKFIDGSAITAAASPTQTAAGQFPAILVPEFSSVFTSPAVIHSIQVIRAAGAGFFNNSVITAQTIASAHLGQMGADGGGIAAHTFASVTVMAKAGSVDLASLRLGQTQLRSSAHLTGILTSRGIAYQAGVLGPDNVLVYGLNLNVLR